MRSLALNARVNDSDGDDGGNDTDDFSSTFGSDDTVAAGCGKASTALITVRSAGVIWIPRRLPILLPLTVDLLISKRADAASNNTEHNMRKTKAKSEVKM